MATNTVTIDEVVTVVRRVVSQSSLEIEAETPLLSTGIVDSLAVAELGEALAKAFDVRIDIEDLGADNADSPRQLCELVNSRR